MTSLRAIQDAKHLRETGGGPSTHLLPAIDTLLTSFTKLKEDFENQFPQFKIPVVTGDSLTTAPKNVHNPAMTAVAADEQLNQGATDFLTMVTYFRKLLVIVEDFSNVATSSPSKQRPPLKPKQQPQQQQALETSGVTFDNPSSSVQRSLASSQDPGAFPMPVFDGSENLETVNTIQRTGTGTNMFGTSHFNSSKADVELLSSSQLLMSHSIAIQKQLQKGEDEAGFMTLNSYVVVNEIGDGTTAKVLQVCDMLTSKMFAVKRVQRGAKQVCRGGVSSSQQQANSLAGSGIHDFANKDSVSITRKKAADDVMSVASDGSQLIPQTTQHPHELRVVTSESYPPGVAESNEASPAHSPTAASEPRSHTTIIMDSNYNFRKEIAIMKKLRHPNLVKLHEVIDDNASDDVFLVMDYVDGGPLLTVDGITNAVTEPTDMPSLDVVKAQFRCITNAIKYLHRHGIAHLDIKPENILLNEHGDPIIIDFGVAHQDNGNQCASPTKFGTPYFFSPEQCEGVPANEMDLFAADIWALGVTLYTMLFHKLPFHAATYPKLRDTIQHDYLVLPKECDSDARSLLTSMLCKDPNHRITIFDVCRHPFVKKGSRRRPGDLPGGRRASVAMTQAEIVELAKRTLAESSALKRMSITSGAALPSSLRSNSNAAALLQRKSVVDMQSLVSRGSISAGFRGHLQPVSGSASPTGASVRTSDNNTNSVPQKKTIADHCNALAYIASLTSLPEEARLNDPTPQAGERDELEFTAASMQLGDLSEWNGENPTNNSSSNPSSDRGPGGLHAHHQPRLVELSCSGVDSQVQSLVPQNQSPVYGVIGRKSSGVLAPTLSSMSLSRPSRAVVVSQPSQGKGPMDYSGTSGTLPADLARRKSVYIKPHQPVAAEDDDDDDGGRDVLELTVGDIANAIQSGALHFE